MGRNNRQRRAAKARRRERSTAERSSRMHAGLGSGPQPRSTLDELRVVIDDLVRGPALPERRLREIAEAVDIVGGRSSPHAAFQMLSATLRRLLAWLWEHGWQPAELTRLMGRELGRTHRTLVIDAIAAQHLAYEGVELHPDWQRQLDELGATRWWERHEDPLQARAARDGSSRVDVIIAAVQLARLITLLPKTATLLPPPGSTGSWRTADDVDRRVLAKIRALLAKAESTPYPHEAEALTAKAQELMTRHAIDAALLHGSHDEPVGRRVAIDDPYAEQKALLLQVVAEANGCRAMWGKDLAVSTIVGFGDQLAMVELLYTSLLTQGTSALIAEGRTDPHRRQVAFRRSFLGAYAIRIGQRLEAAEQVVETAARAEHGDALLPVLAARRSAVDDMIDELFPHSTKRASRSYHAGGWTAGHDAADRAQLGHEPRLRDADGDQVALGAGGAA